MRRLILVFLVALLSLATSRCEAGIETGENFTTHGQDIRTTSLAIQDNKLLATGFDWSIVHTNSIKNTVYVRIIDPQLIKYVVHFTVTLNVQYFTNKELTNSSNITVPLHVDYDPASGKGYKVIDTYDFSQYCWLHWCI